MAPPSGLNKTGNNVTTNTTFEYSSGTSMIGSGGDYNFATNTEVLQDVIKALADAKNYISKYIDEIYTELNGNLKNSWDGEVYQAFIEKCEFYHPVLDELVALLGTFENLFAKVMEDATTLNKEVTDKLAIT